MNSTTRKLALAVLLGLAGCGDHAPRGKAMPPAKDDATNSAAVFHQVVREGSLDQLTTFLESETRIDAPGRFGQTALMIAMGSKRLPMAKLLIEHGADLELTDDLNKTALNYAVEADFAEGVRYLLSLGVDRGYQPRYPLKKLPNHSISYADFPSEVKETLSEAEWNRLQSNTAEMMKEFRENPKIEPAIREVQSIEVLKLFLEAGDELSLAPTEVKRKLLGLETGGELRCTANEFQEHKSPRYGRTNPEQMDFPFWRDMIRTGVDAYVPRKHFNDESPFVKPGAVWCYDRFGSTLTELGDGRYVQIAGEHEDYYDPDFFIYNDVVIHDGKGDFQIYGYPKDVFPPTDFHTATLCPDGIYIIGGLGYGEQRKVDVTPVYRLTLDTWRIDSIPTTGEMPGCIHNHRARYEPERNVISVSGGEIEVLEKGESKLVPNSQSFELDISRRQWRRTR